MAGEPDREAVKALAVRMRKRAGTRKRLAELVGSGHVSTPQSWEKQGVVPEGPTIAILVQLYPDMALELVRAIAPGVDPLPLSPAELAAAAVEELGDRRASDQQPARTERRRGSRRATDLPPPSVPEQSS